VGRGRGLLRLAPIRLRICHEPLVERRIGSESSDACYLSHARDDIMHVNGQLARQGRGRGFYCTERRRRAHGLCSVELLDVWCGQWPVSWRAPSIVV